VLGTSPEIRAEIELTKTNLRYYFGYDFYKIGERESAVENFPCHARRSQRPQPVHRVGFGGKDFAANRAGMETEDGARAAYGRAAGKRKSRALSAFE
jgi:hypothetical protein